jgi:caa(3)-type oxidase subunit IV
MDQNRGHETHGAQAHRRPNYLLIFAALAVITALEVGVSYVPDLPQAPVLLSMSLLKAVLVVAYFMHLKTDSRWFAVIFLFPFLLVIPLLLMLAQ